jgi:hypothetical protein
MKKIIYTRPDGGVSVVSPAKNINDPLTFTEDDRIQRALKFLPPEATNVQVVDEASLPTDRTFRNGWEKTGSGVAVNMNKARDIHRDNMRRARAPKLVDLDVRYLRADELGDLAEKQRIATAKQDLRDVTAAPAIDAVQSPDELKAVWPACLK